MNISFTVESCFPANWDSFLEEDMEASFDMQILNTIDKMHGLEYMRIGNHWHYIIRRRGDIMLVDKGWKRAVVFPPYDYTNINTFLCQMFYTHAIKKNAIYFHSSLIDFKHNGIMFLGPSGIGKTTQAELWHQYRKALIINGDVVFVQEDKENFYGWGTPWHGSSDYCENTNVPIKALIVLKQASENSIRELFGYEKVKEVSKNVIYPTWIEQGLELCLEILDHLLKTVPVYQLLCRPDEDAVHIVEKTI